MEDRCVCCGEIIPEGRMVCPKCEKSFVVLCFECVHGQHIDCPEGWVWCDKMCRYMPVDGYCYYGVRES